MPNIITTQVLERGPKFTVVKYTIIGDNSGEETLTKLFDASLYSAATDDKIFDISYNLNGFTIELFWEADVNVRLMSLAGNHPYKESMIKFGGYKNNGGEGQTGSILFTTTNLGKDDDGHIIFRIAWR